MYLFIVVKQCPLPALPNLEYSQEQALPGTTTTVTCQGGYILKGEASLTCNDDGTFEQILPVCERKLFNNVEPYTNGLTLTRMISVSS